MNLERVSGDFNAAVEASELAWALLRIKRECPRLLARYIRSLRRCRRLRSELTLLLETGSL